MARLIKDYSARGSWYTNFVADPSRLVVEPAGSCPYYPQDPILRFELRDGDVATYDAARVAADPLATPRERIQLQHDSFFKAGTGSYNGVPTNGVFAVSWAAQYGTGWPNAASIDRWQINVQLHGQDLDQAIWMNEVRGTQTRLNHNAGRSTPRYGNTYAPLDPGVWHHYAVVWKHSTGSDGWLQYYRDGVLLQSYTGQLTDLEAKAAYLCVGIYRNANVNGTAVWRLCGLRVHDAYVPPNTVGSGSGSAGSDTPVPDTGSGGGTATPLPDPTPSVSIVNTPATGGLYTGTIPYRVDVANAPAGASLYVGIAPAGQSSGAIAVSNAVSKVGSLTVPSGAVAKQYFYAALHSATGLKLAEQIIQIQVSPAPGAPPASGGAPPTPVVTPTPRGSLLPRPRGQLRRSSAEDSGVLRNLRMRRRSARQG